jgi:hypothetical protein
VSSRFVHRCRGHCGTAVSYDIAVSATSKIPAASAAFVAAGLMIGMSTVSAADIDTAASATASAKRIGNQTSTADPPPEPQPQSVQYRVTVISDWTSSSHPATLPSNSHFSPAVVAVHADAGDLFRGGATASPGIEQMAELGSTGTLLAELDGDETVLDVERGSSIFGAGQNRFTVTLTQEARLVSAVTMLAPSPDWFVGVRDVELFVDGEWIDRVEIDLSSYDAGTDSGTSWRSPNADTNPALVISEPRDAAFTAGAVEGRFGRLVVERI